MKEKQFRYLPAFVTLMAGLITCLVAIFGKFSLVRTLWTLVVVMTIFFVLGAIARVILSRTLQIPKEEEEVKEDGEEAAGEEGSENKTDKSDVNGGNK